MLYLPEPPTTAFQAMHDFRRLPEAGLRRFSPELTLEIRLAQQRRELAIELFQDADEMPAAFTLQTALGTDPREGCARDPRSARRRLQTAIALARSARCVPRLALKDRGVGRSNLPGIKD